VRRPYYIVPEGKVGHDAFAVIETIRSIDKVAIARVVFTNREHIIALEGKALVGMLVRHLLQDPGRNEYFDDFQDVKVTKDMLAISACRVAMRANSTGPPYSAAVCQKLGGRQDCRRAALIWRDDFDQMGYPLGAEMPA
jgi:DNA end-binding protein Ku